jgi:hypothetical protein
VKPTFWWYLPLLLLASVSGAKADAGWYDSRSGGLSSSQEHPTISMVSEYVDAEMKLDYTAVSAEFTFKNNGAATEVMMYFPLDEEYLALDSDNFDLIEEYLASEYNVTAEDPVSEMVLPNPKDFTVEVGDTNVPVELVAKNSLTTNHDQLSISKYARWSVSFAEDEEKKVTCKYSAPYAPESFSWKGQPTSTRTFKYVLYTGSSWAGPIGEGTIIVRRSLSELDGPWVFFASAGKSSYDDANELTGAVIPPDRPADIPPAKVELSEDEERIVWKFAGYSPGADDWIKVAVNVCGLEGISLVDGLNFRTLPSSDADLVEGLAQLSKDLEFKILESNGEWWQVSILGREEGYEGWIRWRYVDPDNGAEYLYATINKYD